MGPDKSGANLARVQRLPTHGARRVDGDLHYNTNVSRIVELGQVAELEEQTGSASCVLMEGMEGRGCGATHTLRCAKAANSAFSSSPVRPWQALASRSCGGSCCSS